MSTLSAQEIVKILEGTKPTQNTSHKGYCSCSYTPSIIESALRTQTGIVPGTYNPKAVEGVEERVVKKPKKSSKDQEFKRQLKKYLNGP